MSYVTKYLAALVLRGSRWVDLDLSQILNHIKNQSPRARNIGGKEKIIARTAEQSI
jgi:hypothetical protein